MREALDVIWETLRDWYNGMVGLAVINFVWFVLSLTVILLPPATAGLYTVTSSLAHGKGAHFSDLWPGMRRYVWVSYRWALANIGVAVVLAVGIDFYGRTAGVLGAFIQALFASAGMLWLTMQLYTWPFLMEQETLHLRQALKNALFLTLANPVYAFMLLGTTVLAVMLSLATVLPLAIFVTSFVALLGSRAVVERLTTYGKLPGMVHNTVQED